MTAALTLAGCSDGRSFLAPLEDDASSGLVVSESDRRYITLSPSDFTPWRVDVYLLDVQDGSLFRITADGVSTDAKFLP
jgi:hypothetical protein